MAEVTDARRIAGLHGRLMDMADEFEDQLDALIREAGIGSVGDERVLRDTTGPGGVLLKIEARKLDVAELAEADARVRQGGRP